MAFIIPDKSLEKLFCDSCNKYLSVPPVKIYRNGKTKCGRCAATETPDDGVLSLMGLISAYCSFKCINRFDGCRKLLPHSQVLSHEKTCTGKLYQCPVCQDGDAFTSLVLERHFRVEHERTILEYPWFIVNLTVLLEHSKMLFYRQKDLLFCISFRYNHSGYPLKHNIRMSISLVGFPQETFKITQQLWISSSDNQNVKYASDKIPCTNTRNNWFDQVDFPGKYIVKSILVQFELQFNDLLYVQITNAIAINDLKPKVDAAKYPKDFADKPDVPFIPKDDAASEQKKSLSQLLGCRRHHEFF